MRSGLIRLTIPSTPLTYFVRRVRHRPGLFQKFRMASTLPRLAVFEAIAKHDPESTVAVHSLSGRRFKYGELLGSTLR